MGDGEKVWEREGRRREKGQTLQWFGWGGWPLKKLNETEERNVKETGGRMVRWDLENSRVIAKVVAVGKVLEKFEGNGEGIKFDLVYLPLSLFKDSAL